MKAFNGSYFWLWVWILFCWPFAPFYWVARSEEVKEGHRDY